MINNSKTVHPESQYNTRINTNNIPTSNFHNQ